MLVKVLICLIIGVVASAQQLGHYLQGASGLGSGAPLPAGTYLTYFPYLSQVTSVKGPNGGTVTPASINIWANMAAVTHMFAGTPKGVSFGFSVLAPWMSQRIQADILPTDKRVTGFSDLMVTPFIFGWTKGTTSVIADYMFVPPTGNYTPTSPANPGLGFWSHVFQLGSATTFGGPRMWNASIMSSWEVTSKKKGVDIHVGPSVTIEPAIGKRFLKGLVNLGVAGHYYQKLSPDSGEGIRPLIRGLKDRAFGVGPELQCVFPRAKMAFTFRFQPQFEVRNRIRSNIWVVNLTYLGTHH